MSSGSDRIDINADNYQIMIQTLINDYDKIIKFKQIERLNNANKSLRVYSCSIYSHYPEIVFRNVSMNIFTAMYPKGSNFSMRIEVTDPYMLMYTTTLYILIMARMVEEGIITASSRQVPKISLPTFDDVGIYVEINDGLGQDNAKPRTKITEIMPDGSDVLFENTESAKERIKTTGSNVFVGDAVVCYSNISIMNHVNCKGLCKYIFFENLPTRQEMLERDRANYRELLSKDSPDLAKQTVARSKADKLEVLFSKTMALINEKAKKKS